MSAKKKTVFVIYYSEYGHVLTLAREICKGLEKAGGKQKQIILKLRINITCLLK
jgi:hypothetical protein